MNAEMYICEKKLNTKDTKDTKEFRLMIAVGWRVMKVLRRASAGRDGFEPRRTQRRAETFGRFMAQVENLAPA